MATRQPEASLGDLFADLSQHLASLVRQELRLAQTEATHKLQKVGRDVAMLAAGGVVVFIGVLAMVAAVILLLALAMPAWLAALIVGIVIAAVGGFLVQRGLSALKEQDYVPRQTVESLKENAAWAREQAM